MVMMASVIVRDKRNTKNAVMKQAKQIVAAAVETDDAEEESLDAKLDATAVEADDAEEEVLDAKLDAAMK